MITKSLKSIKEAAEALGINYSTAKHIIKIYKKTGSRTVLPKIRKKKLLIQQ